MPVPIQELLEELSRQHFPNPPATLEEVARFEQQIGWRLDPDLRAFYLYCNGAELFERPDSPYRFLPLSEIARARIALFGEDTDEWGPSSTYAICDVLDGNFVLIDVAQQQEERYPLIDGWHEAYPDPVYCKQIATCFSEFLVAALRSSGRHFWLKPES